ncbi:transcriptional regulator [Methanosarcina sp. KYL-1]|uniref:ArsR/SmtB family transcription factor n=1 Tax=Methanosarcina sp. KYL-1 TaxID=2602068 RepID=UPI002100B94B|nr:helix-turn-helix domain-containing protein [Methanosarcina sp. KYL-1]
MPEQNPNTRVASFDNQGKLLFLPLSGGSRKLARLLSNETSLRVLDMLGKKSMSAGDLSESLGIRLNTLKYNLDALEESGLIRVQQIKWSRKGREIKMYMAVEQLIVLVPGKSADPSSVLGILNSYSSA